MVVVIATNVAKVKQAQEVETNTGKYIVYSSYIPNQLYAKWESFLQVTFKIFYICFGC